MNTKKIVSIVLRLVAAFIMVQTLYFKFSGQPESIYIFTKAGMEPWGRIGTGVAELIASVLLLIPSTIVIGAVMAIGLMAGALGTHLLILGIEVQGDGGQLFIYALIVLLAGVALLSIHSGQLTSYRNRLFGTKV
jgi:putative oxidoreductase